MPGEVLTVLARVRLDWSAGWQWAPEPAPCRICHQPTRSRDPQGSAVDKSCAERELAAERVGQAQAVIRDERAPVRPALRQASGGAR